MGDDTTMLYALELDELDDQLAVFRSTRNSATLSMPRDDWEAMGRLSVVAIEVRP